MFLSSDIHTVASKIAAINKVNVDKVRSNLVNTWLPSTLTNKLYDGDSVSEIEHTIQLFFVTVQLKGTLEKDKSYD